MTILTMIELQSYIEKKKQDKEAIEEKIKEYETFSKTAGKIMESSLLNHKNSQIKQRQQLQFQQQQ
jgi:hypothetical protein